jgi:hypothetical protein
VGQLTSGLVGIEIRQLRPEEYEEPAQITVSAWLELLPTDPNPDGEGSSGRPR